MLINTNAISGKQCERLLVFFNEHHSKRLIVSYTGHLIQSQLKFEYDNIISHTSNVLKAYDLHPFEYQSYFIEITGSQIINGNNVPNLTQFVCLIPLHKSTSASKNADLHVSSRQFNLEERSSIILLRAGHEIKLQSSSAIYFVIEQYVRTDSIPNLFLERSMNPTQMQLIDACDLLQEPLISSSLLQNISKWLYKEMFLLSSRTDNVLFLDVRDAQTISSPMILRSSAMQFLDSVNLVYAQCIPTLFKRDDDGELYIICNSDAYTIKNHERSIRHFLIIEAYDNDIVVCDGRGFKCSEGTYFFSSHNITFYTNKTMIIYSTKFSIDHHDNIYALEMLEDLQTQV